VRESILRKFRKRWNILHASSTRKAVIFYLMITFAIYGAAILLDHTVVSELIGPPSMTHTDIGIYRERTQAIIDGKLLYRDVHTETPPLVNYIMVPAQLLGGSTQDWVYALYFSLFAFLTATILYLGLKIYDEKKAFITGLVFLLSPFVIVESAIGVQDEAIISMLLALTVVLITRDKARLGTAVMTLGVWTKMFTVLLLPIDVLRTRGWKERIMKMIIFCSLSILIATPFLLICGDQFMWFLKFYFVGVEERAAGGNCLWLFLHMGGIRVPNIIEFCLVAGSLMFGYWFSMKKNFGFWESSLLTYTVFFIFYPKIHTGYYMVPLILFSPYAAQDRRVLLRLYLLYLPVICSAGFAVRETSSAYFDHPWGWICGLILSLAADIILIDTAYIALKQKLYIDRPVAEHKQCTTS